MIGTKLKTIIAVLFALWLATTVLTVWSIMRSSAAEGTGSDQDDCPVGTTWTPMAPTKVGSDGDWYVLVHGCVMQGEGLR